MSDNVRCADVFEISTEDGANICQWEYWGGDGQKFILEAAEEVKTPEKITGDVNADGSFDVADIVMLEKYILGAGTLTDWLAGDLYNDGVIDVFDKIKMRKEIIKQ
jgi:arabinan endo-1,5-alpha-L-arabinosidase